MHQKKEHFLLLFQSFTSLSHPGTFCVLSSSDSCVMHEVLKLSDDLWLLHQRGLDDEVRTSSIRSDQN